MSEVDNTTLSRGEDDANLFDRVVAILEEARNNVVKSVNQNMVRAYWLIGREIVEEVQRGEGRAEYGKKALESLSKDWIRDTEGDSRPQI